MLSTLGLSLFSPCLYPSTFLTSQCLFYFSVQHPCTCCFVSAQFDLILWWQVLFLICFLILNVCPTRRLVRPVGFSFNVLVIQVLFQFTFFILCFFQQWENLSQDTFLSTWKFSLFWRNNFCHKNLRWIWWKRSLKWDFRRFPWHFFTVYRSYLPFWRRPRYKLFFLLLRYRCNQPLCRLTKVTLTLFGLLFGTLCFWVVCSHWECHFFEGKGNRFRW